jgi:hypothetical protein
MYRFYMLSLGAHWPASTAKPSPHLQYIIRPAEAKGFSIYQYIMNLIEEN